MTNKKTTFSPTIQSLCAGYQTPAWFRDAKFGIYIHWGVYSVIARHEWYPRHMYDPGSPDNLYHIEKYGHPSRFGYKDLIPLWKAEKFDPDEMVALVKRAGARYFTPCAVHHDNFDLWNSRHHKWNAVNMGPRRDIIGLLRQSADRAGLRFGVTTHLARAWSWFATNKNRDTDGHYDGNDPELQDFYLGTASDQSACHPTDPPPAWCRQWKLRMFDLIDQIEPDHLYFDGAIPFRGRDNFQSGLEVLAYLYNQSIERNGTIESVMCIKDTADWRGPLTHGLYVPGIATLDLERKLAGQLRGQAWQTDDCIKSKAWCWTNEQNYCTSRDVVEKLVDIVSKNGNLLLNIPPMADGSFDDATVSLLHEVGDWLNSCGEAIYNTRPWKQFGEGDVRFTTSKDHLYAILLSWPSDGRLTIRSLADQHQPVTAVSLLGDNRPLATIQDASGLTIALPPDPPRDLPYAWCLKMQLA